ncbi:DUF6264 family protein [Curtobacterium flaccumfaciens]|uniref:DUF6264 family protein n=1 Tax=Curtobacterium flaccumfaciens TaxID=2035 RepID=UPI001BDF0265|nr:DUF6264 family protein [Curtobacterium flaccumfaciens]MBT1605999.1 hypothetical protein [Curtobacterium flaccumfaciens pv. betae]MBT1656498.1 hypothetical protein [Curtobacterium flaccumfaciens pv. betae]MCS0470673.1 DUF6264 family protein [Curtobacterium flaccumfaciens pv. betae]MCS0473645.1 DUF6264 family protein [Curtobacterium flaccumfaciens pv. betae]MCS0477085.1 DUF6264 family protein [Curtobacterium flaccumfaciens pv. betae]
MTWSNVPGPPPQSSSGPTDAQRAAWERGGTTLFPPAKLADRISTVLLLVFGAVMTAITAVVGIVAIASATAECDASAGCTPGGYFGGAAIAVGGAFVIGVATIVLSIGAWIRRKPSWWIAAIGFVLAIVVITWGGVVFVNAVDSGSGSSSVSASA